MKRTILFLLLIIAAFCACKKEDSIDVNGDYISFKADGVLKTIKSCQGQYFKHMPSSSSRVLIIGNTDKDEQMILDLRGTLDQPYRSQSAYYAVPMGGIDTARYTDYTLGTNIQSLTTDRVTGTFQFTAKNNTSTKNITEGKFGCKVVVL